MLELIQESRPTDPKLVAQCLYDRVDRGNQIVDATNALEELRRRHLLGYSEKTGYKVQSSAGEEWARERRDVSVPREALTAVVTDALKHLLATPDRPRLHGRPFPWAGLFSDGRQAQDETLADPRDDASVRVDFRLLIQEERVDSTWIKRSDENGLRQRLLWLAGDPEQAEHLARELGKSRGMIRRYTPRRESLPPAKRALLNQEEHEAEDLERQVRDAVAAAWMAGRFYFQSRAIEPADVGATFPLALQVVAERILPALYPHFVATQVQPSELKQLLEPELSGVPSKFLDGDLGLLELDGGRYTPTGAGVVPRRVHEAIVSLEGASGAALLQLFGGPPYGYTVNVVKACVAALLRGGRLRIQHEGSAEITAVRDAGVRDLFESDRLFRRATILPAGDDDVGAQGRARIARFLEHLTSQRLEREDPVIADAVAATFPRLAERLRTVTRRLDQLPGDSACAAGVRSRRGRDR